MTMADNAHIARVELLRRVHRSPAWVLRVLNEGGRLTPYYRGRARRGESC